MMSVDYDLVVIGNTLEASYAALEAAKLKARVALVQPPLDGQSDITSTISRRSFSHFNRLHQLGGIFHTSTPNLTTISTWAQGVSAIAQEPFSPVFLAAAGVDVIPDRGEFCRLPQLAFVVGTRKLRSRSYLLATASTPTLPDIKGLSDVSFLTPDTLWHSNLPPRLLVLGETPTAIEFAQNLGRIGKEVTLIVKNSQILPQEEPEAARLLQAQLEADGIQLLVNSLVTQVRQIDGYKWIQAGNQAIEADEMILATPHQAKLAGLNLEGVGVETTQQGIKVDRKFQTTNPKIYACGSATGGDLLPHICQYEASIALKNALFFPWFTADYQSLPQTIFTNPPLARVGLTEAQARRLYGDRIYVFQQYFKTLPQAHLLGETTGFCKLIARANGTILGGHIVGTQAEELINAIALAIKQHLKIKHLASVLPPYLTTFEIIPKTILDNQKQLHGKQFLDSLFFWWRKWS